MTIIKTWSEFYQIKTKHLSKGEMVLLEIILCIHLCDALIHSMKEKNKTYLRLLKSNLDKEYKMIESHIVRFIINDIISSEEYTLDGIAYYTNTPHDVVYDLATGSNINPSLSLSRKVIALHRSIKPDFYRQLMNKIIKNEQENV